ncbi:hypothetical protein WA171_005292 [Blastocystis sp. BT1]
MDSLLSATDIEKLKQYFAVLDTTNSGTISKNDAILIVRALGIPGLDEDYNSVISGMSANISALSMQDVINIAISMKKSQTDEYESIIQVFKMFDKNQDGTVLAADLRQILSHLGEVIPEEEIDSLMRSLGFGDVIKYEELAKALLCSN